jgi:hypothetical protein
MRLNLLTARPNRILTSLVSPPEHLRADVRKSDISSFAGLENCCAAA